MAVGLDVYLYGERIASISRRRGVLSLKYADEYAFREAGVPISVQFPVSPGRYSGEKVDRFLENLLPDREDVRSKWARDAGLDTTAAFELLGVYGADVAGALEFYPHGVRPSEHQELRPVDDEEIADRIRRIRRDDSNWADRSAAGQPFSLGGAQGKFALAYKDAQWFEPRGSAPSTHIFKPGVKGHDGSDVTEHVTMRVARALGMGVATTELREFAGEHVLVVERFDRVREEDEVVRIHQEDLAQATGTAVLKKYEKDGGPSVADLFLLFDRQLAPAFALDAKRQFAESLVFAWFVGHNDGHSKNYSLQMYPGLMLLAPLYDLNCNLVFEPESTCRAKDYSAYDAVELAFSVNQSRRLGDFSGASLRVLEADAGLPAGYLAEFARRLEERIADALRDAIDELPEPLQQLTAVKNYPFVIYAQRQRVRNVLSKIR